MMKSEWNANARVGGIVAEYNPFHRGHAYQLQRAREMGMDYLIVVMSGDFVQRGTPAICSKWERTRMALEHGADLVLELPVGCAVSSAAYFSFGSVYLLNCLGVVTDLVFGCETLDLNYFEAIAQLLIEEPPLFREVLFSSLSRGDAYPRARMKAVMACLPGEDPSEAGRIEAILSLPNNLLALEYVKALRLLHSPVRPLPLLRRGVGHHGETDLAWERDSGEILATAHKGRQQAKEGGESKEGGETEGEGYKSAGQLRMALEKSHAHIKKEGEDRELEDFLFGAMPEKAAQRLLTLHREGLTLFPADLNAPLALRLFQADERELCRHREISPDLARRILSKRPLYQGMEEFASLLKTKQVTHTRIQRGLLHLLLGLLESEDACSYARVLGFRREGSPLLRAIKERGSLPLVTKPSASPELREDTVTLFAGNFYEALLQKRCPSHKLQWELSTSPIVL